MHRLFVAIDLPEAVKDQLTPLLSGVPGAKWVSRPQLHLTLKFIGEVETPQFNTVADTLRGIQAADFEMALNGVGRFPPKGAPRVLWVGVTEHPTLMQLQQQIESTLVKLDIPPEDRAFSAHITLARCKTPPPRDAMDAFLTKHRAFKIQPFPVSEFILFSSVLAPQGPTYRRERVYRLG